VLSAYGMGLAKTETERQFVINAPLSPEQVDETRLKAKVLESECEADLAAQGVGKAEIQHRASALMRYARTETAISVELTDAATMAREFERVHRQQFGFAAPEKVLLIDTLIVESESGAGSGLSAPRTERATEPPRTLDNVQFYSGGAWHDAPLFGRAVLVHGHTITGPAIITEETGTIVIEPGWEGTVDADLCLILRRKSAPAAANSLEESEAACDPVKLEIFASQFMSIAEQMGIVLRNTAQSVNVKERLDFSCALFDAGGDLIANAPHVPVHLGSMDASVKTIVDSGAAINPGDAFVHNNPHKGGSHLPDVTVVSPVFDGQDEVVLFYVASRAHHEDIGGISPGSMSPRGRTIGDEGVLLDNVKLVEDGEFQTGRIERLLGEAKHPARNIAQNVADMMAQVAANAVGARELRKLVSEYGFDVVRAYMGHIQDTAEAAVRRVIGGIDRGDFRLELDSGAVVEVAVRTDPASESATIDFTGTSAQQDSAFNAPPAITRAAVLYVFRCLIDDDVPLNAGCVKPLTIKIPEGSMLNPRADAAVVAGNV
ncbi:MAG: hydantoinase B/oxoprolinase family protein, partial [Pseudomonadota bacterium]